MRTPSTIGDTDPDRCAADTRSLLRPMSRPGRTYWLNIRGLLANMWVCLCVLTVVLTGLVVLNAVFLAEFLCNGKLLIRPRWRSQ